MFQISLNPQQYQKEKQKQPYHNCSTNVRFYRLISVLVCIITSDYQHFYLLSFPDYNNNKC